MLDTVAKGFFDILFNLIKTFIYAIMWPLTTYLPQVFSGIVISDYTQNFYGIINQYLIPSVNFFVNMIPPKTWSLMLIYFDLIIVIYGVVFALHYVLRPLELIKKLVPFT